MKSNTLHMPAPGTVGGTMAVQVGRVVGSTSRGEPLVDFPGNSGKPVVARALTSSGAAHTLAERVAEVLLVFEDGDPVRPIIVGVLDQHEHLERTLASGTIRRDSRDNVTVDGSTLELVGRECVVLSCGKSSIALYADGRVVIKGTRLLSRASESNKIKGATIALN
ncbi:MAG TPA: DUF6484 domain-containing protein [Vicinamibacterales bacterium]|jgi:hypothetical protein|nr:DUF6484 domain-containing protein [Vicinamibacterales bacterium]